MGGPARHGDSAEHLVIGGRAGLGGLEDVPNVSRFLYERTDQCLQVDEITDVVNAE